MSTDQGCPLRKRMRGPANFENDMKIRALTLSLLSLATLAGGLSQSVMAQGLRPSGSSLSSQRQAPNVTLPQQSTSSASSAPRAADFIVAVVNSEPITNNDVSIRMERFRQQMAAQGVTPPPPAQFNKEVLERLIMEKIQVQTALEMGLKVDDYAVNQAQKAVAQQNKISEEEMVRRLAADGITVERFRSELRNQMLMQRLRERDVEARVKVSDLDVEQYLRDQRNAPGAAGNAEINLGHILVSVPEGANPQVEKERLERAQKLMAEIRGGKDFSVVARESSDAGDAAQGGVMGLRSAERYPELFVNATQKAAVGSLVGPVRSPAGFHVLKVVDRSLTGVPSVAMQSHARHILLRMGAQTTEQQAAERLEDFRRRVSSGQTTFEALAKEYSQDGSAKDGGDLGWASPGRYVPEFEEALNGLQPGEMSQPILSRFGMHLIQLIDRREVKLSQREQRDMVRDVVREKKLDEAYANWLQESRARAYVEYREPPQ